MNFSYLKHNFVNDGNCERWYICKKCNIKYYCGEFVSGFPFTADKFDYNELTCDEVIIKQIIE